MTSIQEIAGRSREVVTERARRAGEAIADLQAERREQQAAAQEVADFMDLQDTTADRIDWLIAQLGIHETSVDHNVPDQGDIPEHNPHGLPRFNRIRRTTSNLAPLGAIFAYPGEQGGRTHGFIEFTMDEGLEAPDPKVAKPNPQRRAWPLTAKFPTDSKDGGYTRGEQRPVRREQARTGIRVRVFAGSPASQNREDMLPMHDIVLPFFTPSERLTVDQFTSAGASFQRSAAEEKLAEQGIPEGRAELLHSIATMVGIAEEAGHYFPSPPQTPNLSVRQFGPAAARPPRS